MLSLLVLERCVVVTWQAHRGARVRQNTSLSGVPVALRQKFLNYQLAAPTNFIRGTTAGKLASFRLDFVSVTFP